MDCIVRGVAKSRTRLSDFYFTFSLLRDWGQRWTSLGSWPLFTCDWICTFRDKNYCALGTVQRYDEFMVRPTEKLLVYRCSLDCSGRTRGVPGGPKAPLCATPEPGQCPAPKSSQSLETLLDDRERPTAPWLGSQAPRPSGGGPAREGSCSQATAPWGPRRPTRVPAAASFVLGRA